MKLRDICDRLMARRIENFELGSKKVEICVQVDTIAKTDVCF